MCPLAAGGTVALAGEYGAGLTVVMEELVRRLSGGADPVSLFVLMPPFSAEWPGSVGLPFSISGALKHEGYSHLSEKIRDPRAGNGWAGCYDAVMIARAASLQCWSWTASVMRRFTLPR